MPACARPAIGAVLLFALALTSGCHKPEEESGLGVLPPDQALGTVVVDTSRIIAWTIRPEAGKTSALSRNVLGTYLDPDFGLVTTGLVTQVRLNTNNVGADTTEPLVCDSLVLSLAYDATSYGYGNRDPQGFRVFRITEDLRLDSVYASDDVPTSIPIDLLAGPRSSYDINPFQGPVINGDTLSPQLRLPLNKDIGQTLFLDKWGQGELANNEDFLIYFKGLLVIPNAEASVPYQQAALYFNLLNPDSKLTLYYHSATDTTSFDFIIGTSSVRYSISRFDHDRALQPTVPMALLDTSIGQQHIHLQAMGGLRGELRFPGLENYSAAGFGALAKAELVLPVEGNYFPLYAPPSQVFVFRKDDEGNDVAIPDQVPSSNQVGGFYNAEQKEYHLVITQWLQGVMDGTYPNTGLSVIPGSNGVSVNRVILAGPENPVERTRLRLTFTTY